ncbi:MAG TPA: UDP-N-acetylmuramoyl-L-alanine--D-glutamate ligase [Vicinamibacterales bacterium]|nr:UDP-N-acetylmuramoyl-L-alanine--D-glutamate ligase [Vicinamibacterales bacterium]
MRMGFDVAGQQVVVVGAARSGLAAARLLVARGAHVTLADTAPAIDDAPALEAIGIRLALGEHDPALFAAADLLVLSPGVPADQPAIQAARAAGRPVIGELELASRWIAGRLIAISGTKGKSTTTSLTARMLEQGGLTALAGGNLGTALAAQVRMSTPTTIHVVEASSFQLEATDTFHPWIAVLLNLTPDHLDRHASFEAYGRAKARLFANQTLDDWSVVNADDPGAQALARSGRARRFDFALDRTIEAGVTVDGDQIVRREGGRSLPLVPLASVRLPGRHQLSDVLAAAAVGCLAGIDPAAMQQAVEQFQGLEHALERVAEVDGVTFVNDSKATNIDATRRSIESFDGGVVVILGGRFKGGRFEDLREVVTARVRAVVAIGEAQPVIEAALGDVVPVERAESMADAVRRARAAAHAGGVVLLAPACASFDQFRDYADRGRAFKAEVARLPGADRGAGRASGTV